MSFSADAVANHFIDSASGVSARLTPMKIQKLVFFGHGWYLALSDKPLISERIEAWKWGPVVRSLYTEFREFGNEPVDRKAHEIQMSKKASGQGWSFRITEPSISDEVTADDDIGLVNAVLNRVWTLYGKLTAAQLSEITHREGEPWRIVRDGIPGELPQGIHIPNELIRECFKAKLLKSNHMATLTN